MKSRYSLGIILVLCGMLMSCAMQQRYVGKYFKDRSRVLDAYAMHIGETVKGTIVDDNLTVYLELKKDTENQYTLTGETSPSFGGNGGWHQLDFEILLVHNNEVVDEIVMTGYDNVISKTVKFNKQFTTQKYFNGLTLYYHFRWYE